MKRSSAFLLLEVVVALMLLSVGMAMCMHFMAQLTCEHKRLCTMLCKGM